MVKIRKKNFFSQKHVQFARLEFIKQETLAFSISMQIKILVKLFENIQVNTVYNNKVKIVTSVKVRKINDSTRVIGSERVRGHPTHQASRYFRGRRLWWSKEEEAGPDRTD